MDRLGRCDAFDPPPELLAPPPAVRVCVIDRKPDAARFGRVDCDEREPEFILGVVAIRGEHFPGWDELVDAIVLGN